MSGVIGGGREEYDGLCTAYDERGEGWYRSNRAPSWEGAMSDAEYGETRYATRSASNEASLVPYA